MVNMGPGVRIARVLDVLVETLLKMGDDESDTDSEEEEDVEDGSEEEDDDDDNHGPIYHKKHTEAYFDDNNQSLRYADWILKKYPELDEKDM